MYVGTTFDSADDEYVAQTTLDEVPLAMHDYAPQSLAHEVERRFAERDLFFKA